MSDYSPPYTDEDAKLDRRRDKASAKLLNTNLTKLTVGDLFVILEAYKHGYLATSEHYIS